MRKKAHILAMILVIIGSLNWGLVGTLNVNLVQLLFSNGIIARTIYIAVAIAAISLMFHRDTYLPFLGKTVMPCSILSDKIPTGASETVIVHVRPNAKVLYWATESSTAGLEKVQSWKKAYTYENAGVCTADKKGVAVLKVRKPQAYTVPYKGLLAPHVHYRECTNGAWLNKVKTAFVN